MGKIVKAVYDESNGNCIAEGSVVRFLKPNVVIRPNVNYTVKSIDESSNEVTLTKEDSDVNVTVDADEINEFLIIRQRG